MFYFDALTSAHNYSRSHSRLSSYILYHIYFRIYLGENGEHGNDGRLGNKSDYSPAKFSDGTLEVQSSSTCSICCDLQGEYLSLCPCYFSMCVRS
jgi:hypothetical protein